MKPFKKGVFITATDTEVGKTFVSALLIRSLRQQGVKAGYFKPVASGCRLIEGVWASEDLLFIQRLTEIKMEHELHCPVHYQKPLAPLAAAMLEKRPLKLEKIWNAFDMLQQQYPCLVVEGIGGVMVPLKENYLVLDLMADLRLPTIIVCRPSLGTVNHTLLTLNALENRRISIIGFLTNGFKSEDDEAAQTSPAMINRFSKVPYLGHIPGYDPYKEDLDGFINNKALCIKQIAENCYDSSCQNNVPIQPPDNFVGTY